MMTTSTNQQTHNRPSTHSSSSYHHHHHHHHRHTAMHTSSSKTTTSHQPSSSHKPKSQSRASTLSDAIPMIPTTADGLIGKPYYQNTASMTPPAPFRLPPPAVPIAYPTVDPVPTTFSKSLTPSHQPKPLVEPITFGKENSYKNVSNTIPPKGSLFGGVKRKRGPYLCGRCGLPKKGHECEMRTRFMPSTTVTTDEGATKSMELGNAINQLMLANQIQIQSSLSSQPLSKSAEPMLYEDYHHPSDLTSFSPTMMAYDDGLSDTTTSDAFFPDMPVPPPLKKKRTQLSLLVEVACGPN